MSKRNRRKGKAKDRRIRINFWKAGIELVNQPHWIELIVILIVAAFLISLLARI